MSDTDLVLLRAFVREYTSHVPGRCEDDIYSDWMDAGYRSDLESVLDAASDAGVDWESFAPSDVQGLSSILLSSSALGSDRIQGILNDIAYVFSIDDDSDHPGIVVEDFGDRSFVHAADTDIESIDIPFLLHVGDWLVKVTTIMDYGFEGCTSLRHVGVPEGLDTIEACAFKGCTSLRTFDVPASMGNMAPYLFKGCTSLESVNVHPGNRRFRSVDGVVFTREDDALVLCPEGKVGDYILPEGTKAIANSAFEGCSKLTSVSIPASVTSIVNYGFDRCTSLRSIDVDDGNPRFSSSDGILFDKDGSTLIRCPEGFTGPYAVPDKVTCIEYAAFSGCSGLESIFIPDGVRSIRFHVFEGCTNLRHVSLPRGLDYTFPADVIVDHR